MEGGLFLIPDTFGVRIGRPISPTFSVVSLSVYIFLPPPQSDNHASVSDQVILYATHTCEGQMTDTLELTNFIVFLLIVLVCIHLSCLFT